MPGSSYVDALACNLARVLPDTSRCVFYTIDHPATNITRDLTVHLGEPYIARTHAELAVIIDGVEDVNVAFIFSNVIDDVLSNLLHVLMDFNKNLWIIHVKKFISADMTTGIVSANISFNLLKQRLCEATSDLIDYKFVVFEEIENRICLDALRAMATT